MFQPSPHSFRPILRFMTLMLANNETGAIQPVGPLVAQAAERNIPVHTDAIQAVGRIPVDFHELGVTTIAASGHKFHGPVGVGVLLCDPALDWGHDCLAGANSRAGVQARLQFPLP